jgi:hypothetical protein
MSRKTRKSPPLKGEGEPTCAKATEDRRSEQGDDYYNDVWPICKFRAQLIIPHCPLRRGTLLNKHRFYQKNNRF